MDETLDDRQGSKLAVGFDSEVFEIQKRGGITRYFRELMTSMSINPESQVKPTLLGRVHFGSQTKSLPRQTPSLVLPDSLRRSARWVGLLNKAFPVGQNLDLVHHTYYGSRYAHWLQDLPSVVTVHDMTPELHPEWFPKGNPHQGKLGAVVDASLVLCVSQSTKRDLLSFCPNLPTPIVVTHLGVSDILRKGAQAIAGVPQQYFLFLGPRRGYKSFETTLISLAILKGRHPELHMVAVGGGPWTRSEQDSIRRLKVQDLVLRVEASDPQLSTLLRGAVALAVPSHHEGFSLPVLEAMTLGCPVVISDISAHREVAQAAATFFEANDAESLARGVARLVEDDEYRELHVEAGLVRSRDFSWEETAAMTARAYLQVARE